MPRDRRGRRAGLALCGTLLLAAGAAVRALPADTAAAATSAAVDVLQVRPDVYMLTLNDVNVAVQTGPDGVVIVNSGPASSSGALLAAIQKLAKTPIRYLINTSGDADLTGGNVQLAPAGLSWIHQPGLPRFEAGLVDDHVGVYATIVAHQNVLTHMLEEPSKDRPEWLLPGETFTRARYNFYINGQGVGVIWMPAAHSDGDTVVRFEGSDVVVTGAVLDMTRFPMIDVEHGGSIQGEIDALNRLLNELVSTPVPVVTDIGGTLVIPVRGPLCNQGDAVIYRDMVVAMRDRVRALINEGKSLKQVQAAHPTQGFDRRFGSDTGSWTTTDFVAAVFKSLTAEKRHDHVKGDSK